MQCSLNVALQVDMEVKMVFGILAFINRIIVLVFGGRDCVFECYQSSSKNGGND